MCGNRSVVRRYMRLRRRYKRYLFVWQGPLAGVASVASNGEVFVVLTNIDRETEDVVSSVSIFVRVHGS